MSVHKDKTRINRILAHDAWTRRLEDDAYVSATCTLLMSSIEHGLKYLIESDGIIPCSEHKLSVLLSQLPTRYSAAEWYPKLVKWRNVTDNWYTSSRYRDDFSAVTEIVEDYFDVAAKIQYDTEHVNRYVDTIETRVKTALTRLNSNVDASSILPYLPEAELPDDVLYTIIKEMLKSK